MRDDNLKLKRNLTALVDFSRIINSSIDLQFILNNVLLTCLGKFLSTKGLIALNENGKIAVKNSKGLSNSTIDRFPVLKTNENCLNDERLKSFMDSAKLKVAEKISSSDECIGMVCLGEKLNKSEYTESDRDFLITILNISATAIQNSIRINELQGVNRELDSRIQRLNALFELSKEFGLFSESAKVAKLLVFSIIGQFMVSKFAVVTMQNDEIQVLDSKFDNDVLLENLKSCDSSQIRNSMNQTELETNYPSLYKLGINLAVPMQIQGKTKGLILLGERINKQPYSSSDIEFIYSVGSLAIISLENNRLFIEELEKRKMEEELDLAREIQQNLLPQKIPEFENFEIAAINMSSKQVGGDYYDVIALDENRFCVAIADVSGKGAPASLLMANIQAFLQVICRQEMHIAESTGLINDLIFANTSDGRFITFFWCLIKNKEKKLTYVNAGHNPPLLIRNGKITKLQKGGVILGVIETMVPYLSEELVLQKDDVLVLFTDGISEAMNKKGEEFSDEKLEKTALKLAGESADNILNGIKNEVRNFAAGAPQSDDITMLVIKVK
ncbi:SpoIIE family protein phosphatase [bacterium BMS3Abin03]|nr:SpoIIE family protein phosphatase [bacterium BMS3Abin03]